MAENDEIITTPRKGRPLVRLFATPLPALLLMAALAMAGGSVAAVKATEKPSFCATCHEMSPYRDAWAESPHKDVTCTACHVDPGTVSQMSHKVVALKEVYSHYTSSPKFPQGDAEIPDARCLQCHGDLPAVTKSGFEHARHVKQGACIDCHRTTGHRVAPEALERVGALATDTVTASAPSAETSGTHVAVNCSNCHDLKKTACETCHTARHTPRGTCTTCHTAGPKWAFGHPAQNATCTTCHEAPKRHFAGTCNTCHLPGTPFAKTTYKHTDPNCSTCHSQPAGHRATGSVQCSTCHAKKGQSWEFGHPASGSCSTCHGAPRGHFGSNCASCHKVGTPFAKTVFRHTSKACADCHRKPSGHFTGTCSGCHTPSVAFAATKFRHPSSTNCASCHRRPSGHRSGTCSSCHKSAGRNWSFSHPSSSSCSSCHRAPSSHFGTNCASCHKIGSAWSSAKFSHPRVTGGEHTYRSFACSKCHPSSPPKVGCTCHGGGSGPVDD